VAVSRSPMRRAAHSGGPATTAMGLRPPRATMVTEHGRSLPSLRHHHVCGVCFRSTSTISDPRP
jgi:hypothetical protein